MKDQSSPISPRLFHHIPQVMEVLHPLYIVTVTCNIVCVCVHVCVYACVYGHHPKHITLLFTFRLHFTNASLQKIIIMCLKYNISLSQYLTQISLYIYTQA